MIENEKVWNSFVELSTRISYRSWSKGCQVKLALDSLYSVMQTLRNNLSNDVSLVHFRIIFPYLNTRLGPFLAYWHGQTVSFREVELDFDVKETFNEDLLFLQKETYNVLKQINDAYEYYDAKTFGDIIPEPVSTEAVFIKNE